MSSSPGSIQRAQAAARAFVQKSVQPGDLVGVATLDARCGYRLLANFTTDRAGAAEAIDRPLSFRSSDPLQIAATPMIDKMYVRSDLVVPKHGETVLLQSFVLDDPQAWLIVRGAEHDGEPYPFHVNGQPFVPSAAGHPPAGGVRKVAVFVSNAQPEELRWETTAHATLLAQVQSAAATKMVWQLDDVAAQSFGVTMHKTGAPAAMTASTPISPAPR